MNFTNLFQVVLEFILGVLYLCDAARERLIDDIVLLTHVTWCVDQYVVYERAQLDGRHAFVFGARDVVVCELRPRLGRWLTKNIITKNVESHKIGLTAKLFRSFHLAVTYISRFSILWFRSLILWAAAIFCGQNIFELELAVKHRSHCTKNIRVKYVVHDTVVGNRFREDNDLFLCEVTFSPEGPPRISVDIQRTRWAHDLHFLELGGPREELFVGVLVAQDATLRIDLLRLLLVAPVHLQLVLPVPVPPGNQSVNQSIN